ncbi:MAG: FadR family transcriptional regulator [Firmicutes bacterium]|nr:FadR family transcriptional regulator [Bacillota bacterium]
MIKKPKFKPYKKSSAHRYVSQMLKDYIITGVYSPGDRLPTEVELSKTLGISRAATREGLKELEGLGLISTVQGYRGGRFVKKINSDIIVSGLDLLLKTQKVNFDELMEARKAIECITARKAALNRTSENLEAMSKVLDLRVDSKEEFYKRNFELHEIVARASQNMVLFYVIQAIRKLIYQTYSNLSLEENDIELVMRTHRAIYEAIKNRDPKEAEKAMVYDLEAYRELYLNVIAKRVQEKSTAEEDLGKIEKP